MVILKRIILGIIDLLKLFPYFLVEAFTKSSPKDTEEKSLLIVKLDEIGDYILFRNFLKDIKNLQKFSDYKITLCGNDIWRSITEKLDIKYLDDFIWIDKKRFLNNYFYRRKIIKKIKLQKFDKVINASYSRKYYLDDSVVKWAVSNNKIGFETDLSNCFIWQKSISDKYYDTLINTSKVRFEFLKNKLFYSKILEEKVSVEKPDIDVNDISTKFEMAEDYIVFYMGGRKKYKRWTILNFVEVARFIELNYNCKIILIGSESDKRFSSAFLSKHQSSIVIDLTGKTFLLDVIKIATNAKVVLSNDSGIAHISAAVGTPTIVLLSGTHFGRFFPYPSEIGLKVHSFYPPEIMDRLTEADLLTGEFRYILSSDINLIRPELVNKRMANWF